MAAGFCLRKTAPVGGKGDPICPNTVLLTPDKPLSFGRVVIPGEANVRLLSRVAPLMISRKHATISFSSSKWTLVDHESLNGVFVNGNKLQGNSPHELQLGDTIVFGVGIDSSPPEFEYTFDVMPKVKKRQAEAQASCSKDSKQRKVLSESGTNVQPSGSSRSIDCETQIEDKIRAAEDRIEKLSATLEEKEKSYDNVTKLLEITEKTMETKLLQQKDELEQEKAELERSLKELLTYKLQEKEECLSEQLANQKDLLIKEKDKVEESLQQELNRKLELKDKELELILVNEKAALEKVISEKEMQQRDLQVELRDYKTAVEKMKDMEANEKKMETNLEELKCLVEQKEEELKQQQEVTKKAQDVARKTVVEEMEDEFSCIICQELFMRATTLACSHSFCEYCLYSWLKKRNTCPVCRCPVQTQPVHSIVLDNAIAKMNEVTDDDNKKRRKALLQERAEKGRDLQVIIPGIHAQRTGTTHAYHEPGRQVPRIAENVLHDPRRIQPPIRPRYNNYRYDGAYDNNTNYNDTARGSNYHEHGGRPPYHHYRGHYNSVCYTCGIRGHLARGCPYGYRR